MIAIFSTENQEESTARVMQWLRFRGADAARFHVTSVLDKPFSFQLSPNRAPGEFLTTTEGRRVDKKQIGAVWYRHGEPQLKVDLDEIPHASLRRQMHRHVSDEAQASIDAVYARFSDVPWLSTPADIHCSKLDILIEASRCGLLVPETLFTNDKTEALHFKQRVGDVLVKSLSDETHFHHEGQEWSTYTALLDEAALTPYPRRIFPLFCQAKVAVAWKVHTYYMQGRCWSMAVFQNTRRGARSGRTVPYALPTQIEKNMGRLMRTLELETGSIDLVRATNGCFYFLGVNPRAQFDHLSNSCNYYLEREIADNLIAKEEI